MVCEFWRELDDDGGMYEYCTGADRRVTCCGTERQCNYPHLFRTLDKAKRMGYEAGLGLKLTDDEWKEVKWEVG
jgi:hypothetical protein